MRKEKCSCIVVYLHTDTLYNPLQVAVPLACFRPAVASPNKKLAKAQAALACLQGLGFVQNAIEYSTA